LEVKMNRFPQSDAAHYVACGLPAGMAVAILFLAATFGFTTDPRSLHAVQDRPRFADRSETVLVSFEVVVSGPDGPVSGLARDEFEVTHDGRRVELTHFAQMLLETAPTPTPAGDAVAGADGAAAVAPPDQPEPTL
jgi:hypothetical protein